MSRLNLKGKDDRLVVVGLDHALGYFIQVWGNEKDEEEEAKKMGISVEEYRDLDMPMIDKDQGLFCRPPLSRTKMILLVRKYAEPSPRADRVVTLIAANLDPAV